MTTQSLERQKRSKRPLIIGGGVAVVAIAAVTIGLVAAGNASGDDSDSAALATQRVEEHFPDEDQAVKDQLSELYAQALDAGENEVVVFDFLSEEFTQQDRDGRGKVIAKFEEAFPEITVTGVPALDAVEQIHAEATSGNYVSDVVIHGDSEILQLIEEGDLIAKFEPAGAVNLKYDEYADPEGYAYVPVFFYNDVIYNTDVLSEDEVPTTWEELADPKWAGRFAVQLPENVPAYRTYVSLAYNDLFDDEAFVQLYANGVKESASLTDVAEGKYDFILYVAGSRTLAAAEQGTPVSITASALNLHNRLFSSVLENAAHPHAARLFQAFQFTYEAQEEVAAHSFHLPTLEGIDDNRWPAAFADVDEGKKLIPFRDTLTEFAKYQDEWAALQERAQ